MVNVFSTLFPVASSVKENSTLSNPLLSLAVTINIAEFSISTLSLGLIRSISGGNMSSISSQFVMIKRVNNIRIRECIGF